MSQETNSPLSQDNPQKQPANNTPPPKRSTAIYWVVIVALLGVCIWQFVNNSNLKQTQDMTQAQLDSTSTDRERIQQEYDEAAKRLDDLLTQNMQKDSSLKDRVAEVEALKTRIKKILDNEKATASDLSKARDLIANLNSKTREYEERIAMLETENTDLSNKNEVLAQERDSTVAQNIAIKKVGSVLHASNIRMVPVDLRKGGKKETETTKAKRTDLLRITFDIDENRIADDGNKDLFLRITGPDGTVLSNAAYGSGVTTLVDGSSLNYTLAKQVALKQGQPVNGVNVDWHQGNTYQKGTYKIEIYNEGYRIGNGTVALK